MELIILITDLYREHSENEKGVAVVLDVSDHLLQGLYNVATYHPILVMAFEEYLDACCFVEAAEKANAVWYEITDGVSNDDSIDKKLEKAKVEFLSDNVKLKSYEEGWEWVIRQREY